MAFSNLCERIKTQKTVLLTTFFDFFKNFLYNRIMKDKQSEYIKILAQKIAKAEQEIRLGKNVQENQQKIEDIVSSISFDDMMAIDDYIYREKLLTN